MRSKTLLVCVLLGVLGGMALAQPGPQAAPQPTLRPAHELGENLFPPELIMQHQQAIGLQDAQKTYIRGEISKTQTRFMDLQWQLQDNMESMTSLLKQPTVDEQQVLAQLDKVLGLEREIKRAQIGLMVRIKNNLTPEQQAKLRELRRRGGPTPPPGGQLPPPAMREHPGE